MHTKKVVRRKFNFKKFLILLLILYLILYSGYYLFSVHIKNIIIKGDNNVSDAEIITLAGIKDYPPIFPLNTKKVTKKLLTNPLIKSVNIKKNLHLELIITITENKILMLNKTNNQLLLGSGKYIANNYQYVGIPTLINYAPEDTLKAFALKLNNLDQDIIGAISEIEYAPSKNTKNELIDATRFMLKMNDGNTVYTNTAKCSVLSHYQQIYASLKGKLGILYLDSGNYNRFVFTPYGS